MPHTPSGPRAGLLRALSLLVMLVTPVAVGGCITVESDLLATPTPTAAAATPSALPSAVTLVSPTPEPTPEPTLPPVDAEVLGFMPSWLLADAVKSLRSEQLTIVALHSVEAGADGHLVSRKGNGDVLPGWAAMHGKDFEALRDQLQQAGVKVVPVIQRTGWTAATRKRLVELLSKPKNRRMLANQVATFVADGGFDGVNLDLEPIPEKLSNAYVDLVRRVRAALDEVDPQLQLSLDVTSSLTGYDLAALTADDAADLAVIMGYAYRTVSSAEAGSVDPITATSGADLSGTIDRAAGQADPERLLLALPWYGLSWPTVDDTAGAAVRNGTGIAAPATVMYQDAIRLAADWGRQYEPGQASAWTAYPARSCADCPATWRQAWYDDADSFRAKLGLALDDGLAGVGIWALGMEGGHDELWQTLADVLQPRADATAPGGSAALDPDQVHGQADGRDVVRGSAPLRLFASDEPGGSGLGFVRIGLTEDLDADGRLIKARTYPAVERIDFPLADASTGGSAGDGPRDIHVQWRDLAGNWSIPIVVEAYVRGAQASQTPADLTQP
jgi:spore germination protein YaaH